MHIRKKFQAFIGKLMVALLLVNSVQGVVLADLLSTRDIQAAQESSQQRDALQNLMQREEVRAALKAQGVQPDQALERVAAMSDQEVSQLYSNLQELPAGEGGLEAVALVFVVLIFLELVGAIDIFKNI